MYDFPGNSVYFLTGSTFLHFPYFKTPEHKEIIFDQLTKLHREKGIQICAYSIQINHYHLMFYAKRDTDLATVKKYMHGGVSYEYRKKCGEKQKHFWGTSRVIRVYSHDVYWKVIGYICGNLLKHRELGTFEELYENRFSSYGYFVQKYGDHMMQEIVRSIIDVSESVDGDVDMGETKGRRLRRMPT
ncbi:MAG: hypothetical protein COV60_01125 [Candidatus Magasanikbacteria bacterium CG11_big_fil_rev_8_21_14_0_20_43_7]|uniref:Transposase IS200-like domain-containing protein n=1 Tax=Candidatus Magasanikbacteria bacterium CG11_big_fil_rev_8_21_14_0_20_43_7 TaxID=1974654 RepID=A0A2H0N333_9BACT|nr:MAG: hypothetical protein COV60_01125 [Candidatus Magasanikbacteria bacterium CG11_big_fil_rev_8_21_14_0_20_43_7]